MTMSQGTSRTKRNTHPLGHEHASGEVANVRRAFDSIFTLFSDMSGDLGPGIVVYTPEATPEAKFLRIEDLDKAPAHLQAALHELLSQVPDGNHVPVAFSYMKGALATYVVTGRYSDTDLQTVVTSQNYYDLANPVYASTEPEVPEAWDVDL